jgi:hypothetical protein
MHRFILVLIGLLAPAAALAEPVPFSCTILPDAHSVRVVIANPFDRETHCQVNCQFSTTRKGTSFQISCGTTVQPGGKETELCLKVYDEEPLVKMTGGDGDCIRQKPAAEEKEDDDEDEDEMIKKLMQQGEDFIKRQRKE